MPSPLTTLLLPAVLGTAAAVLLVLWIVAARRLRALRRRAAAAASAAAGLEIAVADQGSRLRIIRELHDVAVHRVSTMVAQADGARYAGAADPAVAVRAAATIADLGRTTLGDMRRVMTLVRESEVEAAPQPRLTTTRELFRLMRDAGLTVAVEEAGEQYDLDAGAELAVYRILQEALANALQHGGAGTAARVLFTWTVSGLSVQVDDDGFRNAVRVRRLAPEEEAAALAYTHEDDLRALTRDVTGAGIEEMRARAALYGGSVQVVETPGVGFGVTAVFPTIRHHNGVHGVRLA